MAVDIGKPMVSSLVLKRQTPVVNSQAMQESRIEVVNVDRVAHDVVRMVVRFTVGEPGTDPPAR